MVCFWSDVYPVSRLHGSTSYRVPWMYGDEACDVLRFYTKLKGKMMPYLWAQAIKTHNTGIPMMKSMIMAFSNDPACKYIDTQYMRVITAHCSRYE